MSLTTTSVQVRSEIVDALQLDLVGPVQNLGNPNEALPQHPSRWYLTGFLVPVQAGDNQTQEEDGADEIDAAGETGGADDDTPAERSAARKTRFPSSIGISVLLPADAKTLQVTIRWGDYELQQPDDGPQQWQRKP